jgi:hypothetical protein
METSDVLSVLTKARALIARPENWCVDFFIEHHGSTTAYCARGAIFTALNFNEYEYDKSSCEDKPYCEELIKALPAPWNKTFMVADYNNTHTHEEVLAMFDKTIARLKREATIKELASVKIDAANELETV